MRMTMFYKDDDDDKFDNYRNYFLCDCTRAAFFLL